MYFKQNLILICESYIKYEKIKEKTNFINEKNVLHILNLNVKK